MPRGLAAAFSTVPSGVDSRAQPDRRPSDQASPIRRRWPRRASAARVASEKRASSATRPGGGRGGKKRAGRVLVGKRGAVYASRKFIAVRDVGEKHKRRPWALGAA